MRRLLFALAMRLLIPGVAHAGGGGVDPSACAGYSEGTEIAMQDSCFSGTAHFAPSDTTITVSNVGFMPHSLTAVDGSFDTGLLDAGGTAEINVGESGIYRVFCTLHGTAAGDGMAGLLVVGEAVPASMAAPLDVSSFEEVVGGHTETIRAAMENQGRTMGQIRSMQNDIVATLDQIARTDTPTQVAVADDSERLVVLIGIGLAVGVALTTLLTMLMRFRVGRRHPIRSEVLQTASESPGA